MTNNANAAASDVHQGQSHLQPLLLRLPEAELQSAACKIAHYLNSLTCLAAEHFTSLESLKAEVAEIRERSSVAGGRYRQNQVCGNQRAVLKI